MASVYPFARFSSFDTYVGYVVALTFAVIVREAGGPGAGEGEGIGDGIGPPAFFAVTALYKFRRLPPFTYGFKSATGSPVFMMYDFRSAYPNEESILRRRAAAPATNGVAIEVPEKEAYELSHTVEMILTPGAAISTLLP